MKKIRYKELMVVIKLILIVNQLCYAQEKSISITIDDVPNTQRYQQDNFKPVLLNQLDSLGIPFTIFINEDKVYKTAFVEKNLQLLESWIGNKQSLAGNHTFSHSRYSDVGLDTFTTDIEKGERLTSTLAVKYNKELNYFRFPFNDLGKDSLQHVQISKYLRSKGYVTTPFTVESSDWMFDYIYCYYINSGQVDKAKATGELYVDKTIALVDYFEKMANTIYGHPVKHIYLCHDNAINARYLGDLINRLKLKGYEIVSLKESLTDPIYKQEDRYYRKWGISWLYRWMDTQKERITWMTQEPDLSEYESVYNDMVKRNN